MGLDWAGLDRRIDLVCVVIPLATNGGHRFFLLKYLCCSHNVECDRVSKHPISLTKAVDVYDHHSCYSLPSPPLRINSTLSHISPTQKQRYIILNTNSAAVSRLNNLKRIPRRRLLKCKRTPQKLATQESRAPSFPNGDFSRYNTIRTKHSSQESPSSQSLTIRSSTVSTPDWDRLGHRPLPSGPTRRSSHLTTALE